MHPRYLTFKVWFDDQAFQQKFLSVELSSNSFMIDSHCHIDLKDFDTDRSQVLERCIDLGITDLVIPGVSLAQADAAFKLIEANSTQTDTHQEDGQLTSQLWQMLGLHPMEISEQYADEQNIKVLRDSLEQRINLYEPIAIGETGFDARLNQALPFTELMILHCELASAYRLPLCVHSVREHNTVIRLLKRQRFTQGGIVHAFSGSYEEAKQYADIGFALGVGGIITYERARKTRETVRKIPLNSLVLETDAPDMPLAGFQGERNSPEQLPAVARTLAAIRNDDIDDVIRVTSDTTRRILRLPPHRPLG